MKQKNITPRQTDVLTLFFNDLYAGRGWMTVDEIVEELQRIESARVTNDTVQITRNNVIRLISSLRNFYKGNQERIIETRSYGNTKRYQLNAKHMVTRSETSQIILELINEAGFSKTINRTAFIEKLAAKPEFEARKLSKAALDIRLNWAIKEGYIREGEQKNLILLGERAFAELLYLEATAFGRQKMTIPSEEQRTPRRR